MIQLIRFICNECRVPEQASHATCKKRNEGKDIKDCDCQHRVP